jgi:AAA family ATP:ADP antiporter
MRSIHTDSAAGGTMSLPRIDPADRRAVAAAAFTAGLLIAQQVASRAVRDAIFLSAFRVKSLPLVMGASAVAALAGAEALSRLQARRSTSRIAPAAAALSTLLLAGWWALGLFFPRAAAVLLYLHVAAFGPALISGFWSLVNERFDPYTARRAVGAIGTGAAAGGVAGGALAWLASRVLPLPATVLGLVALGALGASALAQARGREARVPVAPSSPLPATVLLRNPYLRSIAIVVLLGAVVDAIVDFLFKAQASDRFAAGSLLGAFAVFHAGISVLGLLLQVGLSRTALRQLGIAGTIGVRPAATAAGAILGAFSPGLAAATLVRGAYDSLTNSLFRSGYELLYTPLPEAEKRRVKEIVDVAVDKAGALAGSALVALTLALAPLAAPPSFSPSRPPCPSCSCSSRSACSAGTSRHWRRASSWAGFASTPRTSSTTPPRPPSPTPASSIAAGCCDRSRSSAAARPTRSLPRRQSRRRLRRIPSPGAPPARTRSWSA